MTHKKSVIIRSYTIEDAPHLAAIFYNTIHKINCKDYSPEQIEAWAPTSHLEAAGWIKKWEAIPPLVATIDQTVVGFAELEDNGHIDCFYCHHKYQGKGVGSALMQAIENRASRIGNRELFAEVSITARPFFEAKGFRVVREQIVSVRGANLKNFVMKKDLIIRD